MFSIDPPGCEDIDDALSVLELEDHKIELGIHIADVTYFVKQNTPVDKEASIRGTSIYLVNQRLDMLPKVLSSDLCSLRCNMDRYCVSILVVFNLKTSKIILTF